MLQNPFETICSVLFTPGHRVERFAKAKAVGAHGIMLDMEDAVGESDKLLARESICDYLEQYEPDPELLTAVRVNPVSSALGQGDLAALSECNKRPELIALPKVESADEVRIAAELNVPLLVMIESELGLRLAPEIIAISDCVKVLFFGGYDFAADLGCEVSWDSMLTIRSQLVLLARRFNCALWDVPYINLDTDSDEGLRLACQQVKSLGFTGKMAIHPKHVAMINEVFMPNAEQYAHAMAIVEGMRASKGGACRVNGKMIDQPLLRMAERIVAMQEMRGSE